MTLQIWRISASGYLLLENDRSLEFFIATEGHMMTSFGSMILYKKIEGEHYVFAR